MKTTSSIQQFSFHRRLFGNVWSVVSLASFLLYGVVRLMFSEFPISLNEDLNMLMQVVRISGFISLAVYVILLLVYWIDQQQPLRFEWRLIRIPLITLALIAWLASCQRKQTIGLLTDATIGMTTQYKNLAPQNVRLVMNQEEIHHTDIPFGESVQLLAENVTGFELKNGEAKIGCALTITNEQGKPLMQEPDLFEGHDKYSAADAQFLRCSISTGSPMQYDQTYTATVRFWDKQGDGSIQTTFPIHMIDLP
ncbi:MAG TPA: hypothetical protein PKK69_03945 [Ferruginibacter sp.]|nr:hypothetical protein [Ferruginibacter sp.]